jgi:hypothetical protein
MSCDLVPQPFPPCTYALTRNAADNQVNRELARMLPGKQCKDKHHDAYQIYKHANISSIEEPNIKIRR